MLIRNAAALPLLACVLALSAGCSNKKTAVYPTEPPSKQTELTSSELPKADAKTGADKKYEGNGLEVSSDIMNACKIDASATPQNAPTFDFDRADVTDADRSVLAQVAKCLTTGPLKGRAVKLVGRADARGEDEYNMALGELRADAVLTFLEESGVPKGKMITTSRGELDANGTDEAGWRRDRRVDLVLQ